MEEPKVAVMVELVLRMTGELAPKHPHLTPTLGQGHSLHNTAQGSHKTSQNRVAGEPPPSPPPHTHPAVTTQHKGSTKTSKNRVAGDPTPTHTHTSSCDYTAHGSERTSQNRVAGELSPQIPTSRSDYAVQHMGPTKPQRTEA